MDSLRKNLEEEDLAEEAQPPSSPPRVSTSSNARIKDIRLNADFSVWSTGPKLTISGILDSYVVPIYL